LRGRIALVAVIAAGASLAVAAPPPIPLSGAHAATVQTYCNNNTPPRTRCATGSSADPWEKNKVDAPWTGFAWPMCERITVPGDYNNILSRRCATALQVVGYYDDYCGGCNNHQNSSFDVKMWAGNNHPDQPRTIRGQASRD
jgi:hypothetical protein